MEGASVDHRAWIADRDEAIFPILGDALHISHHFAGGHLGAGWNLALLAMSGCQHLDVSPSYVDYENRSTALGGRSHDFFSR